MLDNLCIFIVLAEIAKVEFDDDLSNLSIPSNKDCFLLKKYNSSELLLGLNNLWSELSFFIYLFILDAKFCSNCLFKFFFFFSKIIFLSIIKFFLFFFNFFKF